jgi:AraC-like DNA-binding protein
MELSTLRIGSLTAGRLAFGCSANVHTVEARNFHVNIPIRGRAVSRSGSKPEVQTAPGEAAVFPPEAPAQITWSAACAQLCLMVSRQTLESELEMLMGRSLSTSLDFDFHMSRTGPIQGLWRNALDMLHKELTAPSGIASLPSTALHIQGLVLDGLLLGHRHNYSELLERRASPGPRTAVARAVELLQSRPEAPWTVVGLAADVHLSVRALQEGFARDLGTSPMTYLRQVRLRQAHAELEASDRGSTTVRAVAIRLGFLHVGRFAATYKATFGESPSETLSRSIS